MLFHNFIKHVSFSSIGSDKRTGPEGVVRPFGADVLLPQSSAVEGVDDRENRANGENGERYNRKSIIAMCERTVMECKVPTGSCTK